MLNLQLDRPIVFFDIEATGINPRTDRLIDLAVVKYPVTGEPEQHHWRVNPERAIPPEAAAIHGIHDADVANCPPFRALAAHVATILEGCDLAGYNIIHFDIPMLEEEFRRSSIPFSADGRRILDAQRIFHKREPRDLSAALKFYCGGTHTGATAHWRTSSPPCASCRVSWNAMPTCPATSARSTSTATRATRCGWTRPGG